MSIASGSGSSSRSSGEPSPTETSKSRWRLDHRQNQYPLRDRRRTGQLGSRLTRFRLLIVQAAESGQEIDPSTEIGHFFRKNATALSANRAAMIA